jgi:cofilin
MLQANSTSGMSVSDDCKQKFMELKRKKTYRYIIFKIDEKLQQITLEKTGVPGASYEDFTAQLPENDC